MGWRRISILHLGKRNGCRRRTVPLSLVGTAIDSLAVEEYGGLSYDEETWETHTVAEVQRANTSKLKEVRDCAKDWLQSYDGVIHEVENAMEALRGFLKKNPGKYRKMEKLYLRGYDYTGGEHIEIGLDAVLVIGLAPAIRRRHIRSTECYRGVA
ncbi:hypothetical protein Aperf_G00000132662 [Anoplocephala perfoliata]